MQFHQTVVFYIGPMSPVFQLFPPAASIHPVEAGILGPTQDDLGGTLQSSSAPPEKNKANQGNPKTKIEPDVTVSRACVLPRSSRRAYIVVEGCNVQSSAQKSKKTSIISLLVDHSLLRGVVVMI